MLLMRDVRAGPGWSEKKDSVFDKNENKCVFCTYEEWPVHGHVLFIYKNQPKGHLILVLASNIL